MKQITAKFSKREEDLELTSGRVIEEMDNNPDFKDPPPELAELKKELPEFSTARLNAEGGDKKKVCIKNDKKAIILAYLQVLADYVTAISKGNRTLIVSSGFEVSNETRTSNVPPSIEKLEVELGQAGQATTHARNVMGAKGYVHQYTKEPPGKNTEWIGDGSSQASHTFEGLNSGQQYWFRVVAIGFKKQKAYSPIVARFIQ